MKEDFLHYVWKFQKFDTRNVKTTNGEAIHIKKVGDHNTNSGPDFFNAKLTIGSQLWAGNVELHLKSSDWYEHRHEEDVAYENVILHVVWEHDTEIFRKNNTVIPTLVLEGIIASETLENYHRLFTKKHNWINCEQEFHLVDDFILKHWLERLYVERLEAKSEVILSHLKQCNSNWEALLFRLLCKNFGLKVNGEAFLSVAQSVDFSVVQKCCSTQKQLESLLMGQAGLLEEAKDDIYYKLLQKEYGFIKNKFRLNNSNVIRPKFFRLRPPNFPTIRLSQLASLYSISKQLFSKLIENPSEDTSEKTIKQLYSILTISAHSYWDTHYNFGVTSEKKEKKLTKKFIDLLLINTILPLKFCYAKTIGKEVSEEILTLAMILVKEDNMVVEKFNKLKQVAKNAMESQALLQLKSNYCEKAKCLECAIGNVVLGSNFGN
ncbi:DUF2851 family protein [Ulvibacter antarcticus]|uniref:Uncharacterized protein DUF2851 n=1 Tax=Ulvibacter antarcticus TaxID=442714 RepID=A0A3L9YQE3_9FLAO|nr:DUF2851 family protein [Ulvibacter antarcticus]RMA56712.1 uncharacterized protein DUF2851 [Ulvibacter antarcticus]